MPKKLSLTKNAQKNENLFKKNTSLIFSYRRNKLGIPKGNYVSRIKTMDQSSFNVLQHALSDAVHGKIFCRTFSNRKTKGEVFSLQNCAVFMGYSCKGYYKIIIQGGAPNVNGLVHELENFAFNYVEHMLDYASRNYNTLVEVNYSFY